MPDTAAQILYNARWLAGLSQAQVAQRAGVTQQMVAQYEKGRREPTFSRLAALVAGCGVELTTQLVPRPGLEDEPTVKLLGLGPFERLPQRVGQVLLRMHTAALAAGGLPYLVGGKAAARTVGAHVRVHELELWLPDDVDLDRLATVLDEAGADDGRGLGPRVVPQPERILLLQGWDLGGLSVPVSLRSVSDYPEMMRRAAALTLPGLDHPAYAADPHDAVVWWHGRDYDHLALQRALTLSGKPLPGSVITSNPVSSRG